MFCKHKKEAHWINGFFIEGFDTKITHCIKCRKIFKVEKVYIPTDFPATHKDEFIVKMKAIESEIKNSDIEFDLIYEQIYKAIVSDMAKKYYMKHGFIKLNLTPTNSLKQYVADMEFIGDNSYVAVIKKEITDFISSIGGWTVASIVIHPSAAIDLEFK